MKYLSILLLALLALSSCKKDNSEDRFKIPPEPPDSKILSKDTIRSGSLWGITIGSNAAQVYAKLTELKADKQLRFLGLYKNELTQLDSLKTRMALYNTIEFPNIGLTVYSYGDKIDRINRGFDYNRWPVGAGTDNSIAVGDAISLIYQKLVNIKKNIDYEDKFVQIVMPFKKLDTPYDPNMANAVSWYSSTVTQADGKWYNLNLDFDKGKLTSMIAVQLQDSLH